MKASFDCVIEMEVKQNINGQEIERLGSMLQQKLNLIQRHCIFVVDDKCLDAFLNFLIRFDKIITQKEVS